ncbi:MAG TPA: class I SAM-dependent methyltransferase [Mycobacteriales bacterium]|nr:class I SAM-dependent methyltransferase [Mycobacteriales bacterium]
MYAGAEDPWGFRSRWYEQRKREVTLAALTRPRYRRAFEPGCSIGVLTAALADRCDEVLAADVDECAVSTARSELARHGHVRVERLSVPQEWPDGMFDLVVISEVAYYLAPTELEQLLDSAVGSLAPRGTLLACHWRHPVPDYPATGDDVHQRLLARPELSQAVSHVEEDFRLDLLTLGAAPSPARREGLVT